MEKLGCVLELMFGNIFFGEQVGGHIVQKEQLDGLVKLGLQCYINHQNEDAIKYIIKAISEAGYTPGKDVYVALDPAATELFKDGKYHLEGEGKVLSPADMVQYYENLAMNYPVIS